MTNTLKFTISLVITFVGIMSLIAMSIYKDYQCIDNEKKNQNTIDSLINEIRIKDTKIESYEMMWITLKEYHPEVIEKIEK